MQCRIGAFDVRSRSPVEGSKHCNRKVELRPFLEVVGGRIVKIDNIGLMLDDVSTLGFVH